MRIYLLFSLLLSLGVNAQQVSVFQSITVNNGLPSNYVFDASEDENGFLWVGTDKGLAKFDGFRWRTINKENGLPGNYVNIAQCDGHGGVWLGIAQKGIFYYNIKMNTTTFVTDGLTQTGVSINTDGELFIQKNDSKKVFRLLSFSAKNNFKPTTIFEINNANCDERTSNFDFNITKKTITQYAPNPNYKITKGWSVNQSYNKDWQILWAENGDSIFNKNGTIIIKNKSAFFTKDIFKKNEYIFFKENGDQFYFWNLKEGFWAININGNYKHYNTTDGLQTDNVNKIFISKKKQVFACTLGGGLQMLLPNKNIKISTNQKAVRAMAIAKNITYICTEDKLLLIDNRESKLLESFPLQEKTIESITVSENEIAIGSLAGLSLYKINNQQLTKIKQIKEGAGISTALKLQNDYIYSTYGSGIFNLAKNVPVRIREEAAYSIIEKLQPITNGYAALTYEDGFHLLDRLLQPVKTITIKNGLLSNEVYDVHEYKDTTWVSTAKGVSVFVKTEFIKNILFENKLVKDKCIYSFHSNDGHYWVVTNKKLYECTNDKLFAVSSYSITSNATENVKTALFDATTNTLIAGAEEAITLYNMVNVKRDTSVTAPTLQFTKLNSEENDLGNNFTLPYNFNSIHFTIIPGISNPFLQPNILYKLEGYNDAFQLLKDSTTFAFEKLRPGKYTLVAKAINADEYQSKEVILAQFEISKPYWQELWFLALSTIALVGCSILLYNYFQRKKQLQKDNANKLALSLSKDRERMSKDLHDHLGTSLVTMIAQTDNIENKLINNDVSAALDKIKDLSNQSRESMNVLRETIWAVQENSHTLDEFVIRIRTFLQRVMGANEHDWKLETVGTINKKLSAEQTLQLFRMIQEATQNIIKHAKATEAIYKIEGDNNSLKITVSDNGVGFDSNINYANNGLKNLAARIKDINGTITINSEKQKGTTILFQILI